MKKNMAIIDAVVRTIVAILLFVLYFTQAISGTLGIILLVVGGVFILTSILRVCPIYLVLGISTRKEK